MKKWVALLFVCIYANGFSQTNVPPQFSELKGMEDQLGNTHLFYRIYSEIYGINTYSRNNDIYRFSISSLVDTIFLNDWLYSSPVMESARFVYDYDFWNKNYVEYIFCGMNGFGPESIAYIERFDGNTSYYQWGEINDIDISKQDDSVVYAGGDIFSTSERTIKSSDGGWNWSGVINTPKFISLTPFNNSILFAVDATGNLFKSTDGGSVFSMVDTAGNSWYNEFAYDSDDLHIYRIAYENYLNFLTTSNDQGSASTWQIKYSSDSKIFISPDESISGTIYLADKKNILVSTDYGANFSLYKTLERKIVGIYKKPNSNKLYAATKYKIYEITSDTIELIKNLPIPEEVLDYYPLSIGNFWVYSVYTNEGGNNIYWGDETRTIVDISTTKLGSQVFLFQHKLINGEIDTTYIKLDSLSGKLFASSTGFGDYLFYEDLLAEAGDTVCYEYNPAWNCQYVQPDSQFTEFGLNTLIKKYFPQAPGWYFGHSLVKGIGLFEAYNGDLTTFKSILKGCIIDGIVYGDTIVVSVYDEENPIATEFRLEQNYPNPFNPSTKIKFTIPTSPSPYPSPYQGEGTRERSLVILKVYDVLGNEIATLVNEEKPAGEYEVEFNSHSDEGQNLSSGIYFYQLVIRGSEINSEQAFIQTKKMVLIK